MSIEADTYISVVGVAADSISSTLASGLLALGLHGRSCRVHCALDMVAGLLKGTLLGIGLKRICK